jgi:hypothetical protein
MVKAMRIFSENVLNMLDAKMIGITVHDFDDLFFGFCHLLIKFITR